jgi:hypothetical protein
VLEFQICFAAERSPGDFSLSLLPFLYPFMLSNLLVLTFYLEYIRPCLLLDSQQVGETRIKSPIYLFSILEPEESRSRKTRHCGRNFTLTRASQSIKHIRHQDLVVGIKFQGSLVAFMSFSSSGYYISNTS